MERVDFRQALLTIQMDYVEMPDLKLTLGEATRLWALPMDVCRAVVAALVATGFLVQTLDGSYRRRGTPPVHVEYIDPLTWVVGRLPVPPSSVHDTTSGSPSPLSAVNTI